ncbi:glycoside hydrolase family 172 protein [Haliscomenobacter hydrossis]|uniref:DUF2961 domain-containing protein n=1 Tax=Haliscomenobacter hydrossis (strain ATCC 27775 / DSM 1100 / LMG 10767 / O) TaxID=760192 RepID=F4KX65_HALH1|nr:glycoside hydrolase family 172 protein [Haliscomenobacter hydrossis]AEE48293.1 hypothetical protein Halhy_0382 [Haliscomenobacter hydrossis DSM 1100]
MKPTILFLCTLFSCSLLAQDPLYRMSTDKPRWATFENPKAATGVGGMENKTAKGHAYEPIKAGEVKTLLSVTGMGIVQRIWLTFNDRSSAMMRALRIDMYWDGATQPAVSAPIGDFFGISHGQIMPFENALFSSPEGRSFNCRIPMPFRKGARITVTNESDKELGLFFYDVDFQRVTALPPDALYFHAHWRREHKTELAKDFNMLPEVTGKGRFLGVNVGLITAAEYGKSWWGEGEVKIYLDGDGQFPTIVGTGAEDYIGSGWGLGKFIQWYQGCPIANDSTRQWSFYRFHIPDPIYFQQKLRATIQVLGGHSRDDVRRMLKEGTALIPVSLSHDKGFVRLFEGNPPALDAADFPDGWVNFYRQEDYCATAYFYLDKPVNGLPALAAVQVRTKGM